MPQTFTTPLLRIVQGDLWEASLTDQAGQPRTFPPGHVKAGQPKPEYFVAGAIRKGDPEWPAFEALLKAEAAAAWPQLFPGGVLALPSFSFKIIDGDDATPIVDTRTGNVSRNCDKPGFAGHWIVRFSSGYAPTAWERNPADPNSFLQITDRERVKRGYYGRISGKTETNGNAQKPGIKVYVSMFLLEGGGPADVIATGGADPTAAFGGLAASALPAGVAPAAPGAPVGIAAPPAPMPQAPAPAPAMPAAPAQPYSGYMTPPAAPIAPPPAPPAPVGPQLTAAGVATGFTYAQYAANGWTDEQLRAAGYLA